MHPRHLKTDNIRGIQHPIASKASQRMGSNDIKKFATTKEAIGILMQFKVRTRVMLYFIEFRCYKSLHILCHNQARRCPMTPRLGSVLRVNGYDEVFDRQKHVISFIARLNTLR